MAVRRLPNACAGTLVRLRAQDTEQAHGKVWVCSSCIRDEQAPCSDSHLVRILMKYGGPERPDHSAAAASDA